MTTREVQDLARFILRIGGVLESIPSDDPRKGLVEYCVTWPILGTDHPDYDAAKSLMARYQGEASVRAAIELELLMMKCEQDLGLSQPPPETP